MRRILYLITVVVSFLALFEIFLQIGVRLHAIPYYYSLNRAYYSFNVVPYFSKPCCVSDTISGFRWLNNGAETLKMCRGEVIFRQSIKPNNAGFISPCNWEPAKKDSTVFRWLVFGDSFTDGYFLNTNWPEAVTGILKEKNISPVELHSFALNGSGLKTWAKVFDWLNKNNYQYDGIIIASFGNDLARDYFVMQHDEDFCYYGWCDSLYPEAFAHLFKERTIVNYPAMENTDKVLVGREANPAVHLLLRHFANALYVETRQNISLKSQTTQLYKKYITADLSQMPDSVYMHTKYGERFALLQNMLAVCNQKGKRILLASVPDKKSVNDKITGNSAQPNRELSYMAHQFHTFFFDGYKALEGTDAEKLYLRYDGHWNQEGSDLFANKIAVAIIEAQKGMK